MWLEEGLAHAGAGARWALDVAATPRPQRPHVTVIGAPTNHPPHGDRHDVLHQLGLDADGITGTVLEVMNHTDNTQMLQILTRPRPSISTRRATADGRDHTLTAL